MEIGKEEYAAIEPAHAGRSQNGMVGEGLNESPENAMPAKLSRISTQEG